MEQKQSPAFHRWPGQGEINVILWTPSQKAPGSLDPYTPSVGCSASQPCQKRKMRQREEGQPVTHCTQKARWHLLQIPRSLPGRCPSAPSPCLCLITLAPPGVRPGAERPRAARLQPFRSGRVGVELRCKRKREMGTLRSELSFPGRWWLSPGQGLPSPRDPRGVLTAPPVRCPQ